MTSIFDFNSNLVFHILKQIRPNGTKKNWPCLFAVCALRQTSKHFHALIPKTYLASFNFWQIDRTNVKEMQETMSMAISRQPDGEMVNWILEYVQLVYRGNVAIMTWALMTFVPYISSLDLRIISSFDFYLRDCDDHAIRATLDHCISISDVNSAIPMPIITMMSALAEFGRLDGIRHVIEYHRLPPRIFLRGGSWGCIGSASNAQLKYLDSESEDIERREVVLRYMLSCLNPKQKASLLRRIKDKEVAGKWSYYSKSRIKRSLKEVEKPHSRKRPYTSTGH